MQDQPQQSLIEHTFDNPVTQDKKVNWAKVLFVVIGFLFATSVGMYVGRFYLSGDSQEQQPFTPSPTRSGDAELKTDSITLKETTAASPVPSEWESYSFVRGIHNFRGFVLHYPQSWVLSVTDESGNTLPYAQITLTKGENKITIAQGTGDGGYCLYPEDPPFEGKVQSYDVFVEYKKNDIITWRKTEALQIQNYNYLVCEKNLETGYSIDDYHYFHDTTDIGWIQISDNGESSDITSEIDAILDAIEIL